MGNSQYWTSFWVVGLIILLCFFCLFLGAQVFVFFYDRISTFVSVTIGPGGAVVLTGQTAEPERLQDLLVLTRKLESAVK